MLDIIYDYYAALLLHKQILKSEKTNYITVYVILAKKLSTFYEIEHVYQGLS